MREPALLSISSSYGIRNCSADFFEVRFKKLKEKMFGFDYSIFDKIIHYYLEVKKICISKEMALSKALEKLKHKQAWYTRGRNTIEEKMQFYQEVDIYLFRQPYNKRFGGFRWYRNLVTHIERPAILEYGCGSAVLTEYLIERFPNLKYTVADILSNTLDFVRWKKERYGYQYNILNIGAGKQGIPLSDPYDLIICQDVLEHTPNPLEIVTSFVEHLSSEGVLVVDFINAPGGENLDEAAEQRESVKAYLRENLIPIKAIDEPQGNNGLYVKNSD